jgi:hypothetical protein
MDLYRKHRRAKRLGRPIIGRRKRDKLLWDACRRLIDSTKTNNVTAEEAIMRCR